MRHLGRIIIHHSAGSPDQPLEEIEAHHRARGFDGIGYHFIIDGIGAVHRTRPLDQLGAHDEGENFDSIGVCLLGDNTRHGLGWRDVQIVVARSLISSLRIVFGDHLRVLGHRDEGPTPGSRDATLCPGLDVAKVL